MLLHLYVFILTLTSCSSSATNSKCFLAPNRSAGTQRHTYNTNICTVLNIHFDKLFYLFILFEIRVIIFLKTKVKGIMSKYLQILFGLFVNFALTSNAFTHFKPLPTLLLPGPEAAAYTCASLQHGSWFKQLPLQYINQQLLATSVAPIVWRAAMPETSDPGTGNALHNEMIHTISYPDSAGSRCSAKATSWLPKGNHNS